MKTIKPKQIHHCGEYNFVCKICGKKTVGYYNKVINRTFCSNACRLKNQENPKKTFVCDHCGKECDYKDYNFQRSVRFCSRDCYRKGIRKYISGDKSHFWMGGITKETQLLRNQAQTDDWRREVFERDDYTCQSCGDRAGNGHEVYLHAHHIKSWAKFPELRWDINNGVTLCKYCHRLTDNYGGKSN